MQLFSNPTELAGLQDEIISKSVISVEEASAYIKRLGNFSDILNHSFFGLNAIPKNNLGIRNNFVIGGLRNILGDTFNGHICFNKGIELLKNYVVNGFYVEGYSYLMYIKSSYLFCKKHGIYDSDDIFENLEVNYRYLVAPDGNIPTTDTWIGNTGLKSMIVNKYYDWYSDFYSVHNRPEDTHIFINNFTGLYNFSRNLHVDYEFGHFCIFSKGKWKIFHPWYGGYGYEANSKLNGVTNYNVIINGLRTKEPYWRLLPFKPKLKHNTNRNIFTGDITHIFKTGDITRNMTISKNYVKICDIGGEFSTFNISDDCEYIVDKSSKVDIGKGYFAASAGNITENKCLYVFGKERIIRFKF